MTYLAKTNSSEYYTNLVNARSILYTDITRALDVVKEFIINKNLILVGGMAIDFALRLMGDSIYTDEQIPDYDFYSPDHAADAYELAAILCKKGFKNISCINAMHITTMRVRVDFETVADITYCPTKVYKQVPTLMYDKLRIVHPHWQMIDQHSSLSLPFENPGMEVIFHRWKKDLTRYDILYKHYPVVPVMESRNLISDITLETQSTKKYETEGGLQSQPSSEGGLQSQRYQRTVERERLAKTMEIPMQTVKVPLADISGSCISGWGAIDYKLDEEYITLSIPTGEPVTLASHDYTKFLKEHNLEVSDYYSEYFGSMPRRVLCSSSLEDSKGRSKKIEIYDIFGVLVSAKQISEKHDVWVCNLQWVMVYLLVRIFSSENPKITFTAEEQYLRCRQLVLEGEYPSIEVYGTDNFTHSRLNSMKRDKEKIYNIRAAQLQPGNMYPKPPECPNNKEFDPSTSEYFMTDARKMDGFIEWTLNPYPEFTNKSLRGS
jgi:hypothetical protein